MYNNIEATVINNGTTHTYLKLERGVRQEGFPLSEYFFLITIENLKYMEVLQLRQCIPSLWRETIYEAQKINIDKGIVIYTNIGSKVEV